MRAFHFHTIHDGRMRPVKIYGATIRDAVASLRAGLYDGETIVGWPT